MTQPAKAIISSANRKGNYSSDLIDCDLALPANAVSAISDAPSSLPSVTVCIVSYNRPGYLREALESVLRQSCLPNEIVILDNGSQEDVHEAVLDLLVPPVSWEGAATNHPAIWNFTRAFCRTQGKYLYVMHDDDRLLPNFLAKQIAFLEAHPQVIVVGCNALLIDSSGKRTGRMLFNQPTSLVYFRTLAEVVYAAASLRCPLFPSAVYRSPFHAKVALAEEYGKAVDQYFICELARFGHIAYQNEALFEYRIHPGQDSSFIPDKDDRRLEKYFVAVSASDPQLGKRVKQKTRDRLIYRKQRHTERCMRLFEEGLRSLSLRQAARGALGLLNPMRVSGSSVWKYCQDRARAALKRILGYHRSDRTG